MVSSVSDYSGTVCSMRKHAQIPACANISLQRPIRELSDNNDSKKRTGAAMPTLAAVLSLGGDGEVVDDCLGGFRHWSLEEPALDPKEIRKHTPIVVSPSLWSSTPDKRMPSFEDGAAHSYKH